TFVLCVLGLNIREVLEEDEGGSIEKSIAKLVSEARKKHRTIEKPSKIRLGIMRYVYVAIDCSRSMTSKVMPPSRFFVTMKILNTFVDKFFEQNPISQLGIIIVKDKKAERFVSLTGNTRALKDNLGSLNEAICSGDFSLQNALQLALINLKSLPGHVSREVIVIMSSLSTVDPGNVFSTFEVLRGHNIRCSVIGISAELFVCKQLAKITNGRYDVVLDPDHFELLLSQHTAPPPSTKAAECNAIRVAFPPHTNIKQRS
ncbi:General transcription factor IIH subunit, partial [Trichostrongylus colubriformis]